LHGVILLALEILFVCLGNTGRSGMAKAILEDRLRKTSGLPHEIAVDSAGTSAGEGCEPESYAVRALKEDFGIDMSGHRSKPLNRELVSSADLILCMERSIVGELVRRYPDVKGKTTRFTDYVGEGGDIEDCAGEGYSCYTETARWLASLSESLIRKLGARPC